MKKIVSLIFVMFFALVLVGCGGGSGSTGGLKSIKISGKSQVLVNETETYTATFDPADYADKSIKWSTSDEASLSINDKGEATGLKEAKSVYVYAESLKEPNIRGQKKVVVKNDEDVKGDYPDLQGYTIKIAQAEQALSDMDPWLDDYTQADKLYKQKAWTEVEELFNCKIEVVAYPSSAPWGPLRWAYINSQAALNTADYDFYTVPDSQIPGFVENGALISVEDFYVLYGNDMMDPSFVTSGSYQGNLYSLTSGDNNIYSVMYYNIGMYEDLKAVDPTLKEPAQMFLDGEWYHDSFVDYVVQVQNALAAKYGAAGTANADEQEYYAISGWSPYYWAGLAANDGEALADTTTMKINISSANKVSAAETVKEIYNSGCADPKESVDGAVTSWNNGYAFFNTGDLWFVGDSSRWAPNAWGEDNTKYGYVPWPSAKKQSPDEFKIAMGGTAGWVMPIGRDKEYALHGDDATAENIYWAVALMLQKSQEYYYGSDEYDRELALQTIAAKYAHSKASQDAYIKIQNLIEEGAGYFDPLCVPDNPIGSLYYGGESLRTAVNNFVKGELDWDAAVINLIPVLEAALRKAYS